MKRTKAIVLAAGKGSRMNSEIPKQYLTLQGKPVLFYSLQAFEESNVDEIILVVGQAELEYSKREIVDKYHITKVTRIVAGGEERYESVYYGLQAAEGADYVLIHDGARPLVDKQTINHAIEMVSKYGACVVGMPVKDTIQVVDEWGMIDCTPIRSKTWQAQTPQCFSYKLVLDSYEKAVRALDERITDDAMVVHRYGGAEIKMIEGSYENIKITTPEDVLVAEVFLLSKKNKF